MKESVDTVLLAWKCFAKAVFVECSEIVLQQESRGVYCHPRPSCGSVSMLFVNCWKFFFALMHERHLESPERMKDNGALPQDRICFVCKGKGQTDFGEAPTEIHQQLHCCVVFTVEFVLWVCCNLQFWLFGVQSVSPSICFLILVIFLSRDHFDKSRNILQACLPACSPVFVFLLYFFLRSMLERQSKRNEITKGLC